MTFGLILEHLGFFFPEDSIFLLPLTFARICFSPSEAVMHTLLSLKATGGSLREDQVLRLSVEKKKEERLRQSPGRTAI